MPAPAPTPLASRGPAAARGVGLFLVGVLGAAAAAIAVDARFDLPAAARGLVFAGWLVLAVGLAHVWVIAPLGRPVPAGEWAAAARAAGETAVVALFTLGFFALALLVPGAGDRVRRFAVPWYVPGDNAGFRVVVPSGDVIVARGEPVTLTAYVDPVRPGATVPTIATAVIREAETGHEERVESRADDMAVFAWTRQTTAGFDYRVEVGPVASVWHTVRVAEPVRLTDATRVEIRPPNYRLTPAVTARGFTDLRGTQFGEAAFTFGFSAPPAEVRLDFQPDSSDAAGRRIPVRLTADGRGIAALPLTRDGTAVLTVTQKDGLTSRQTAAIRVEPDTPPRFVTLTGLPARPITARPGDRVELLVEAVDDSRVAGVWVDRCVNGDTAAIASDPVPVWPLGPGRVGGRVRLAAFGTRPGVNEVWLRVRAADDRSLAEPKVEPQTAVYPATEWAVVRLSDSAPPLEEQAIQSHREESVRRLTAVVQALTAAATDSGRPGLSGQDGPLPHEQLLRLRSLAEAGATAVGDLGALADELALIPDLRPFAATLRATADGPLRTAGRYAQAAVDADSSAVRDLSLSAARLHWRETGQRLGTLVPALDRAGQARLDRAALGRLADELRSATPAVAAVRQRFEGLIHRSPVLRPAVAAAVANEAAGLADEVRALTRDVSSLVRAAEATESAARRARAAGLVGRQAARDRAAAELIARHAAPLRLSDTPPAAALTSGRAAELLAAGDATAAVGEQEKAVHEADRLADALRRAAEARTDSKEAARQLARWQSDLARRLGDAVATRTAADRERSAQEQDRLLDAVGRLPSGPDDTARAAELRSVRAAMRRAAEGVRTAAGDLPARLTAASDALGRLADLSPSLGEQRRAAAARLGVLTRQYEAIRRDYETIVRPAGGSAREQADLLAARVADLADGVGRAVPDSPARRIAVAACTRLTADLRAGADHDLPASLADVRRQLTRLATALSGKPTADELAVELAGVVRLAADRAAALPDRPTASDLQPVAAAMHEAAKLLRAVPEGDGGSAPARVRDALGAVEQAARRPDSAREVRRLLATAVAASSELAEQLTGGEPAVERVRRLAQRRADWAAKLTRPGNGPAKREAERTAGQDVEELERTRVGRSRAAKQAAVAALVRARAGTGDAAGLHRAAADALRRLADEMAAAGDGLTPDAPAGPPAATATADPFAAFADYLPTAAAAAAFRKLADWQRAVRDETATVAASNLRGVEPAAGDDLGAILAYLRVVVRAVSRLVSADLPETDPLRPLADGSVGPAATAIDRLARALLAHKDPDGRRLADRLAPQAARVRGFANRYDVQAARQKARRAELVAVADRLAAAYRGSNEASWDAAADQLAGMKKAILAAGVTSAQIGPILADAVKRVDEAVAAVRSGATADRRLAEAGGAVRAAGRSLADAERADTGANRTAAVQRAVTSLGQAARTLPVCPPEAKGDPKSGSESRPGPADQ